MSDRDEWNRRIIEEFRSNGGRVGGPFEGATLLLLHHTGAKTRTERLNPVAYQRLDDGWAIFASKGGAPTNPDWYHNLVANPSARIEVGTGDEAGGASDGIATIDVVARVAHAEERDRIWSEQKRRMPGFAEYERNTTRQIPVVILEPSER
jgi:deazaflavin-dependent oxidoreductase (nitroreductase family)